MMNEEIKKTTEELEDIMAGGIIRLGGEYKKLETENERLRAELEDKEQLIEALEGEVVLLQTQLAEKGGE